MVDNLTKEEALEFREIFGLADRAGTGRYKVITVLKFLA